VLIYFIHHASASIQASYVIKSVADDLNASIDRLFPDKFGTAPPEHETGPRTTLPPSFERYASLVRTSASGYLQAIDSEQLMRLAMQHDLVLRVDSRPGRFVIQEDALLAAWPGDRVSDRLARQLEDTFVIGRDRTPTQDVEFVVDQLVEIAVRALSPGVNDPFTAMACIDRLGEALCRLAQRALPSSHRLGEDGQLRVVARPVTFVDVTEGAFDQIRQYGRSSEAVTLRLLAIIERVAHAAHRAEDRAELRRQATIIQRNSLEVIPEEQDRRAVDEQFRRVIEALDEPVRA